MVAVYKRLGFSVIGKLLRVAKPLRRPKTTFAMFETAGMSAKKMEAS